VVLAGALFVGAIAIVYLLFLLVASTLPEIRLGD
jgi:hypothetical protein